MGGGGCRLVTLLNKSYPPKLTTCVTVSSAPVCEEQRHRVVFDRTVGGCKHCEVVAVPVGLLLCRSSRFNYRDQRIL